MTTLTERHTGTVDYWYRNAAIYALDVATFRDLNGDGWGDLPGVIDRLDYLRACGVDAIWLLPCYSSPWRDNGYDVSDYLSVDSRFGDMADFARLMNEADQRGIRVIVDLVVQHSSNEHEWFRRARESRESPYRDFYIWADEPHETDVEPIFPGRQRGVWARDDQSGQYYRHTFYDFEPDLNVANPKVRQQIFRVMEFWLRLGVAGFRVDAVPYLVHQAAKEDPTDDGHWLLRQMREVVARRRPDGVLIAEADVDPEEYTAYFGATGDEFHMLFNFFLNNYFFLALARQDREPIVRALTEMPSAPRTGQYAVWTRNHDELDLERLAESERKEVLDAFAPDENMRIFGRGIRRRLAPMLGGDQRWLELAYSLVFSLPGSVVLRYGDEIGMGDNLELSERGAIRTPMQWSDEPNAAFSAAAADQLVTPVINNDRYGYQRVNAHAETIRRDSLLNAIGRFIRTRHQIQEVGTGDCSVVDVGSDAVLALQYVARGVGTAVMVNNLGSEPVGVQLPEELRTLVELLGDSPYGPVRDGRLTLNGHGYRWLRATHS